MPQQLSGPFNNCQGQHNSPKQSTAENNNPGETILFGGRVISPECCEINSKNQSSSQQVKREEVHWHFPSFYGLILRAKCMQSPDSGNKARNKATSLYYFTPTKVENPGKFKILMNLYDVSMNFSPFERGQIGLNRVIFPTFVV